MIEFNKKLIFLAPLSNFSDTGMRILSKRFGADLTYTGMISSYEIVNKKAIPFQIFAEERPIAVQIFGNDPHIIETAVKILGTTPDIIDLNFGCPSKNLIMSGNGGYLLLDLRKIRDLIKSAIYNSKVPVSVKIRSGFDKNSMNYLDVGRICEEEGVFFLTIHPRTVSMKYSGKADLNITKELKNSLKIPIIHSGDIFSINDLEKVFNETNCNGVMIGRSAIGNPWIFSDFKDYLFNKKYPQKRSLEEKIEIIVEHMEILKKIYSENYAIKQMKIHIPKYLKGYPGISRLNKLLNGVKSINELKNLLFNFRKL
ncbi:MAG: tRNA-dihydrouridine synthase [Caldisericia bacterium]|jgi:tRNA-dihydrouridine synthase B|nr:tRNA-dihydrouridine synthase [Caldisericia bacterium]